MDMEKDYFVELVGRLGADKVSENTMLAVTVASVVAGVLLNMALW